MQLVSEALLRVLAGWHGLQARAQDEEGQTLAEYGLIMAVIAVAVVVTAVIAFRTAIVAAFNSAANCLGGSLLAQRNEMSAGGAPPATFLWASTRQPAFGGLARLLAEER